MSDFTKLLQDYVNMDYAILVCSAKESYRNLQPAFAAYDAENSGVILTLALITAAIAADGVFSEKEKQFISDVFDIPSEKLDFLGKMKSRNVSALVDEVADSLNIVNKRDLLNIIIAVAACDEKITRSENAFIQRIMIQD